MSPQEEQGIETIASPSANGGFHLRWSRIQKTVTIKDTATGLSGRASIGGTKAPETTSKKTILSNCSGAAAPGQVLAIMGPSGAGKTSLMNVLAGRGTYQGGSLTINGHLMTKRRFKSIAYVKQADIFFEHLTVADQLSYTAMLRLPESMTKAEKNQQVTAILNALRLTKVQHSPIMLCSGGEKKRVNIGTELVTNPSILLLDEPTSGLDSSSAVSLLQLLQSLSREANRTIVTSIHQPSSAVFRSFDRLLMMSDGKVVYFGSPVESLDYLSRLDLACPPGYNAADHWMDLLVAPVDGSEDLVKYKLQDAWDAEALALEMDAAFVDGDDASVSTEARTPKYNTSWLTQYIVLTHRAMKNSRSAIFTPLNLIKSLALGIVAGLLYFQLDYVEENINNIRSYYFFTMTFWVFDSMFGALMAFPVERAIVTQERAASSYHLSAYFMAKTTADAPVRICLPLLYMTVSYWMMAIRNDIVTFIASIGCTLLSVMAGEAFGLLVGASILDLQHAITTMTVSMLFLMLLGGFFVENIPSFVEWAKYLSPFKYAFDSSLQLVVDRDLPCDDSGVLDELCNADGFAPVDEVLDFIGVQGSLGFNVGMLVVLIICCRFLAYLGLRMTKTADRA
ncbi:ATP-binding cassette, subfamily G (WHITE), member 1 [Fistulifera solaris]|uniref:ATP-binding cassette, subfamily G (WHITE), member 1 n=1 Tax=Fistulifera solaris TaxID=1519565 RepID=A0A1Z5K3P7_FISSO|nr:ATP-binding cassette, subfamily G (WHITE), member 1 [Fistulifera solaris]|eukprot:GAX20870.1 ATP-binding cassette, subfamily G (WHITE), member 1 [Fistulifera solaris]